MHPQTRHKKLLENERINDWYENLKASSNLTADVYLRNLGLWLEWIRENPDNVIDLAKNDLEKFRKKIMRQIRTMEGDGKAGSYISVSLRPLLAYLKFYDVSVRLNNINIKDEDKNRTVEEERIPTKEELESIIKRANLRQNAIISLVAFSGLRPGAIGNYTGDDGLKVGDIIDLAFENGKVKFAKLPALVRVRSELSKSNKRYHTFIGSQGAGFIQEYLNERIEKGESLTGESALIAPDPVMSRLENPNRFMMSVIVEREIMKGIIKAGFKWRPYVFRHYFGVNLDASEGKGLISHSWRMHIMGHVGDIETTYSTDKPLPEEIIEHMREAFKKCLKFIETEERGIKEEDYSKIQLETAIMIMETAFKMKLTDEQKEELLKLEMSEFQKRLGEIFQQRKIDELNNGNKHKTIPEGQLEKYLNDGWELVQIYPKGDKAVIKLP